MNIENEMEQARSMYTEYSRIAGGKSLATGQTLPTWDELSDVIRYAWHGSTYKVVQAARREGWEQAKREAAAIVMNRYIKGHLDKAESRALKGDITDAIAAMEYKGESK